jgi:hypothetical protein
VKKSKDQTKKKTLLEQGPVVHPEILEQAKRSLETDKLNQAAKRITKCVICDSPTAPTSAEQLCWVCRRLKISAWRDSDPQMAIQE